MKKTNIFISLSVLFGLALGAGVASAATNDQVNYWTMDEGTGRSVSDSVGGQNGAMTGTSTGFGWASGKVGTGIGMDGTAGTGIALPNGILKGSQGSISLWLNAQDLTDRNIIFSGKSTSDNNIYAAFIVDHDGRPTFQFRDSTNGNDRKAQGAKLLNKNEWYNVVFTANAMTYHIYVNGEEVNVAGDNTGRWLPDFTNQTLSYRIGMLDATPLSGSWNGYLDDLKIFSRALSLDEVKDMYTTSNAARPTVPASVAPKVTLTVSEDNIPFGGSVAINWTSVNTNSCSLNVDPSITATSGSKVFIKLAVDTSYTVSCVGKYGTNDATVKVSVGASATTTATTVSTGSSLTVAAVTPPIAAMHFSRNLTVGSRGDDVKGLQEMLIARGYLGGSATGYFGVLTKAAVIKLQKERALPQSGFFGPMTRKAVEGN